MHTHITQTTRGALSNHLLRARLHLGLLGDDAALPLGERVGRARRRDEREARREAPAVPAAVDHRAPLDQLDVDRRVGERARRPLGEALERCSGPSARILSSVMLSTTSAPSRPRSIAPSFAHCRITSASEPTDSSVLHPHGEHPAVGRTVGASAARASRAARARARRGRGESRRGRGRRGRGACSWLDVRRVDRRPGSWIAVRRPAARGAGSARALRGGGGILPRHVQAAVWFT